VLTDASPAAVLTQTTITLMPAQHPRPVPVHHLGPLLALVIGVGRAILSLGGQRQVLHHRVARAREVSMKMSAGELCRG
jgi:hypothetical protein